MGLDEKVAGTNETKVAASKAKSKEDSSKAQSSSSA